MGYTKEQIINACSNEANKDIRTLYKADFINYKGKTEDTNEYYTEIVCGWILEHLDLLQKIPVVSRTSGYRVLSHDGIVKNANSNRTEEIIAMKMFQQSTIPGLGKIVDYQTPLKNTSSDPVGKIDLLSYIETVSQKEKNKPTQIKGVRIARQSEKRKQHKDVGGDMDD